jgi:cytochrome c553
LAARTFYLDETRSHLNWAVRVVPVRRVGNGQQVELQPILEGIEQSSLAELKAAVAKHDAAAFEAAYRGMLTQCHACHSASGKPYLEPHVPDRPASSLIGTADR